MEHKDSLIGTLQLQLESITFECVPVTHFYTRNVELRTMSAKRCAQAGSCTQHQCRTTGQTTYVPELNSSYRLPGVTRCQESCGGIGCGCLLPMPGCLYSRTYAKPMDDIVYEVFSCPSWSEKIRLSARFNLANGNKIRRRIILQPQKTVQFAHMNITLDFITAPTIPALGRRFMQASTGSNQASMVTLTTDTFALKCATAEIARNLTGCRVMDTCTCTSDDELNHCLCANVNVTERLLSVDTRLPLHNAEFIMKPSSNNIEVESHSSVAEISLSTSVKWKAATVVIPVNCDVNVSKPRGCYNCIQGAKMNFTCTSKVRTLAEITCTDYQYTVECGPKGIATTVVLNAKTSRYAVECNVKCGEKKHVLHISGALYYHSLWKDLRDDNRGDETANYIDLIHLPDISNIAKMVGNWWKASLIAAAAVAVGIAVTVLCAPLLVQRCLWSCASTTR